MDVPHGAMTLLSRRALLGAACAVTAGALPKVARAHNVAGAVVPAVAPPAVPLTLDDGSLAELARLLAGKLTAMQLVFTSCRGVCPIQGALFAGAARRLGDRVPDAQLVSISIDPERDDPKALRAWLDKMGASPRWRAARPEASALEPLRDFLRSRAKGPDAHTAQVYFFDRRGLLVLRSVDFPPATEVVRVLEELDKRT